MDVADRLARRFIMWAVRRNPNSQNVVTFGGDLLFKRFAPFRIDEWWWTARETWVNRLPWWCPINAFVHCWINADKSDFHDHPRWSITICLRGRIIERTPWDTRVLRPGSVVFRSRKFIHSFELPAGAPCRTWTLFIVGRRHHAQNSYKITNEGLA